MRSTLFDTLVELQTLKQSSSSSSEVQSGSQSTTKRSSPGKSDGPHDCNLSAKRPRRSCAGKKTYNNGEDDGTNNDEKKSDLRDEKEMMNQSTNFNVIDLSTQSRGNHVRLETKNFILTGMNKIKLKALCKKEGIDQSGSEDELKARIKRFADFWKSECDREVHRSRAQVVKDFKEQEVNRAVSWFRI